MSNTEIVNEKLAETSAFILNGNELTVALWRTPENSFYVLLQEIATAYEEIDGEEYSTETITQERLATFSSADYPDVVERRAAATTRYAMQAQAVSASATLF